MSGTTSTDLAALVHHHDMALLARKRDGTWVVSPVNPLVEDDHVFFRTLHTSGKAKRLRKTSHTTPDPLTLSTSISS
jgi:hypothetical protein